MNDLAVPGVDDLAVSGVDDLTVPGVDDLAGLALPDVVVLVHDHVVLAPAVQVQQRVLLSIEAHLTGQDKRFLNI